VGFWQYGFEMSGDDIRGILKQLASGKIEAGWRAFLGNYSDLIYSVVLQYEGNDPRAEDCYLHVCAKLSDDGFERLLRFQPDGPARFQTWLTVVTANLCIDWRRTEYGRFRPFKTIKELPDLDRLIFRYRYEYGMALHECLLSLNAIYPNLTQAQFSAINGRLNQLLTSEQHWRLSAGRRETGFLGEAPSDLAAASMPEHPSPGPEAMAQLKQDSARLKQAMARLEPEQRLLLRLRFQHDLTLDEVARHAGLKNLHIARRRLQAALDSLADILKSLPPA